MKIITLILIILVCAFTGCKQQKVSAKELVSNAIDSASIGNYKASERLLSAAIGRDPWLKKGFYLRGKVRIQLGDYKLALTNLEKAVNLMSNGSGYIFQKKNVFESGDDFWEVDYYDLIYQKGVAYVYLDSLAQAYGCFRYLINTEFKEKSSCYLWKGEIMLAAGDSVKACAEFINAKATARDSSDRILAENYLKHCQDKVNQDTFLLC